MNMDGTMGRRRSTTTWAEPWYEYENEDEDAHRKMWANPWQDNHDDTRDKRMDEHGRNHGSKTQHNDMGGTMVRARVRERRRTQKDMGETMEGQARRHKGQTHG